MRMTVKPCVKADLEELLELEKEFKSKANMTKEQKRIKKKIIRKTRDLKFLVHDEEEGNSSDSEYGEEVYKQLFKESKTVLQEMQETTTVRVMHDAGHNDFFQAVL